MAEAPPQPHPLTSAALLPRVSRLQSHPDDKNSALHVACLKGSYTEALMLLLSKQSVTARNVWQETPLHQAVAGGHLDIVMLLLDAGSDVNALDHQNVTPLHQAVIHANRDAAELVLCYGASVHNAEGVTDMMSALDLAGHVHVCHKTLQEADGRVWPLQHLCRIAIRKHLGVSRRRRIKELPLPKSLLSYLCTLPVAKSHELHENWERLRSSKAEAVRKRGEARRAKPGNGRYGSGLHLIRHQ